MVYKTQPEIIKYKIFMRFYIKILDSITSGCILHTKIFRMAVFGLALLLHFLKLSVGNGFYNNVKLHNLII